MKWSIKQHKPKTPFQKPACKSWRQ